MANEAEQGIYIYPIDSEVPRSSLNHVRSTGIALEQWLLLPPRCDRSLEKASSIGQFYDNGRQMKKLIVITSCFLVLLAGVSAAWASCKEISYLSHNHHRSSVPGPVQDRHSDADHEHSHDTAIHCTSLDEFVPTATFSVSKHDRVERVLVTVGAESDSQFTQYDSRLTHGPPGLDNSSIIPPYLLLSVLRI